MSKQLQVSVTVYVIKYHANVYGCVCMQVYNSIATIMHQVCQCWYVLCTVMSQHNLLILQRLRTKQKNSPVKICHC